MVSPKDQVTAQKYDLQFGTNVIGKCRPLRVSGGALFAQLVADVQVPGYSQYYCYLPYLRPRMHHPPTRKRAS